MRRVLFVLLLALTACQPTTDNDPIVQIESAILPRFTIEGEAIETSSLAERMKAENVHGVTIAVAIDGKLNDKCHDRAIAIVRAEYSGQSA